MSDEVLQSELCRLGTPLRRLALNAAPAGLSEDDPAKGAETIVEVASSPDVAAVSGIYFYKCKPDTPSPGAQARCRCVAVVSEFPEFRRTTRERA